MGAENNAPSSSDTSADSGSSSHSSGGNVPAMHTVGSLSDGSNVGNDVPSHPSIDREASVKPSLQDAIFKLGDDADEVELVRNDPSGSDDGDSTSRDSNPRPSRTDLRDGPVDPTKRNANRNAVDPSKIPDKPVEKSTKKEPRFDLSEFEQQQQQTEPAPAQPAKPGKRDYSQFPPEIAEILSEMPNHKFEQFSKLLPEWLKSHTELPQLRKQLEERPPETVQWWYDNEEAYQLTPEYKEATQFLNKAQFEQQFWSQQLNAIKRGDSWYELVGYDAQGKAQYREHPARDDGKLDVDSESAVLGVLSQYGSFLQNAQSRLANVRAQFSEGVKRAPQEMAEVEKKIFSRWSDQTKLTKEDTEAIELVKQLYPKHMRTHPAVKHAGMAFREFQRLGELFTKESGRAKKLEQEVAQLRARLNLPVSAAESAPRPRAGQPVVEDGDDDVIDLKALDRKFGGSR